MFEGTLGKQLSQKCNYDDGKLTVTRNGYSFKVDDEWNSKGGHV